MPCEPFRVEQNPEKTKPHHCKGKSCKDKTDSALAKREDLAAVVCGFDFPYLHAQSLAFEPPEIGKKEADLEIYQNLEKEAFVRAFRDHKDNHPWNENPGKQQQGVVEYGREPPP